MPKKIMNDEIKKYQGRIYYLNQGKDFFGNDITPTIEEANWINSTADYDHSSFELHHMIKFTQYEQNKAQYEKLGLKNCLVLIPKVLHQHLENPIYELSQEDFLNKYKIEKWKLLFNKDNYHQGNFPKELAKTSNELDYDGCFDSLFA